MVPLPVPEFGLVVSQAAVSLAVQVNVPPPMLLILNATLAGLLPPCWAENEKLRGLVPIDGVEVEGGVGVEAGEGDISWPMPGISESSRLNDLDPPDAVPGTCDDPPEAAAVSPPAPPLGLFEVDDEGPTA